MTEVWVGKTMLSGAKWLESLRQKHLSARADAAGHVVYSAGSIVVALRALWTALADLLHPLTMFNPRDWPAERRTEWVRAAHEFDRGPDTFHMLNEHTGELQDLKPPTETARTLRSVLVGIAEDVAHTGQTGSRTEIEARIASVNWRAAVEPYFAIAAEQEGGRLVHQGPDLLIRNYLPVVIWLVRHAGDKKQVESLRHMASGLLTTRSLERDRPLDELLAVAEETFGALRAHLLNKYPRLPYPHWTDGVQ